MTTSDEEEASNDNNGNAHEESIDSNDDQGSSEESLLINVQVDRPALTQEGFHRTYGLRDHKFSSSEIYKNSWLSLKRSARKWMRYLQSVTCLNLLMSLIPILKWLPKYQWKRDFASDCAAGFTIAVMQVPQGLAYAILANVPAIIGIYTAFFPVLIYILLGTSR